MKPIADGVKTFVKTIADAFSEFANVDTSGLNNFADKVQTRFEPFVKLGELVKKAFEGLSGLSRRHLLFYRSWVLLLRTHLETSEKRFSQRLILRALIRFWT